MVPDWTRHPASWQRAFELLAGQEPAYEPTFLHRDFSHRNLLWTDDAISGVVDWVETSTGPAWLDAAHAASNLAVAHGTERARGVRRAMGRRVGDGAGARTGSSWTPSATSRRRARRRCSANRASSSGSTTGSTWSSGPQLSAKSTAARACSAVVAKTGTSTSSGPISSSISVQPRTTPPAPCVDQPPHHVDVRRPGLVADDPEDQLVVDHVVHERAVVALGHEHVEPVRAQPVGVERLLHGEPGAEQRDPLDPGATHRVGGDVGEVDERDVDRGLDGVGDLVHRVGAEHQALGARRLERPGLGGQGGTGRVPVPRDLHGLDARRSRPTPSPAAPSGSRRAGRGRPR